MLYAKDFPIGVKVKNKITGAILMVSPVLKTETSLTNMWVDIEQGDTFKCIDEDLYDLNF